MASLDFSASSESAATKHDISADARLQQSRGNIPDQKRIATCQAKLALLGFTMAPLLGAAFIVSKWGMSRTVAGIEDAENFLRRVGGGA